MGGRHSSPPPPPPAPRRDYAAEARAQAAAQAAAQARAQAEAQARAQAEAQARARAQAEAEARARALAEAQARARAEADAQARARALAEAQARAKAEAEAKAKAEAAAKAKAEAEARARAEAEAARKKKIQEAKDKIQKEQTERKESEAKYSNPALKTLPLAKDVNKLANDIPTSYDNMSKSLAYIFFQPELSQIKSEDTKQCFTKNEYSEFEKPPMIQIPGLHSKDSCKMNVANKLANMKWSNAFKTSNSNSINQTINRFQENIEEKIPGLEYKVISGYFNDDIIAFTRDPPINNGRATSFGNITQSTNGYINQPHGGQHQYSVEWTGFFIPDKTGYWTFTTISDDASYLWLGDNATHGYTRSNVLIDNGGLHPMVTKSNGMSVVKDKKYALRMQFGENWGGHDFVFRIVDSNGQPRNDTENLLFTVQNTTIDGTETINNFDFNANFYYSLTEVNPSNHDLFNCYMSDPTSKSKSSQNNYEFETVWSTGPTTNKENNNSNPNGYSGSLRYVNGNIEFVSNGSTKNLGVSNGIISLSNDGIFYIQDKNGSNNQISSNNSIESKAVRNYGWRDYKYNNNVKDQYDLKSGEKNQLNTAILISDNNMYKLEINDFGNLNKNNTENQDLITYNKQFLTLLQTIVHNKPELLSQKRKVTFENKLEEHKHNFLF
jgi:chemotaxis protein histidine kinase CheA